uniref:Envelope glycoprotein G n=1 Tax=Equine herpesvirus 4 (strain 1942) TaxID=10333 RepID=GG_EHV4|nr:RecName: Full=Envelope glycoprotein G; Short=gG; Flags: Precursor [Equine herpesvirus type 4 (strain 1942)]AAA46103.1 glycoprotein G [Equid alphaherpesvirus 4]AAB23267.1 glycoprotein G [Equid alphaherpesvirus 4]
MLAVGATLCLLSFLTGATGRLAPDDLCYAEPRKTGPMPRSKPKHQPLLFEAPKVALTAESKGCQLILLDPPIDMGYRLEDKINASIAWFFDFGNCRMPIAYREYYDCVGNAIPSPETCDGYSFTLVKTEGVVEFTIVNMSLLLQPGIYDSGSFIYSALLDMDVLTGRVILNVENDTNYPCGMTHGLTADGNINVDETTHTTPHPRAVGCFPELINFDAWENVTFEEMGIPDPNSFLDDESDYPNTMDCYSWDLYTYPKSLKQAEGPQTLLIGAVGLRILAQAWKFVENETYSQHTRTYTRDAKEVDVTQPSPVQADSVLAKKRTSMKNNPIYSEGKPHAKPFSTIDSIHTEGMKNNPVYSESLMLNVQHSDSITTGGVLHGLQDCDNQLKTVYICLALIGLAHVP